MYKNLLHWLTLIFILPSCSETGPTISVACEENNVGNCIIKWETAPVIPGHVKVYASTNPDLILVDTPVAIANIKDERMTIVTDNPSQRYYYLMVFNDKYRVRVATRNVNIPGIQNFRDLGGYKSSTTGLNTRFGMLYRSAQIDSIGCVAQRELRNLNIRTFIDLRTKEEQSNYPQLQRGFNVVHIPIATGSMDPLLQKIQERGIKGDTIYQLIEQMNRDLILNYQKEYRQMFDILLDRSSYPVVIHCSSGKERTGVVSALILASLGVNEEIIMSDYRLSNEYFNIPKVSKYAYKLPPNSQEAITTIFSAREDFLNAAKSEAERIYGDIPTYLKKGAGLTHADLERLQSILLN